MIMLFDQEYAIQQYGKAQKEEGKTEKCTENIRSLMETLKLSAQQAMNALKIPPQEQEKYAKLL